MAHRSQEEQILRASKEIVVKFIETGRISPTSFPEAFRQIYEAVRQTVLDEPLPAPEEENDSD